MKERKDAIVIQKPDLAGLIDHTMLIPDATANDIKELCLQAKRYGFANVCINPCYITTALKELYGSSVGVCAVVGFPLGACDPDVKAAEALAAVKAGASEIDVVINIGYLKSGMTEKFKEDLAGVVKSVRQEMPGTVVKFILETCLLSDSEKIEACRFAVEAGADYVKTSTGFGKSGATVHDVKLLKDTVGPKIGVKASGGIRSLSTAIAMIDAGARRIGTSSGVQIIEEYETIRRINADLHKLL